MSRKVTSTKTSDPPTDPDVITARNGKASTKKCGNPECYVQEEEAPLKACARCKSMRYCSRECQRAHWQRHKASCNNNVEHTAELAKADAEGFNFIHPNGISFLELDQKLEKWVKFHSNLLMAAAIHALELPRDVTRTRSYMLHLEVIYCPDHTGINARAFRFINASVINMASAMARGGVWASSVQQIREMREESEAKNLGTVAVVALECRPLAVQVVPFGSIHDLRKLKLQTRWKEILKRDIESGKKFTRFEMAD